MTAGTLVDIRALSVDLATERGPAHVLREVSFSLPRGRILGLVGESGSGKTTLALSIMGLLPGGARTSGGAILFDGIDVTALGEDAQRTLRGRRMAMIFQDPMTSLSPVFTIGTHLVDAVRAREPGLTRRMAERKAVEMLTRVGIPDASLRLSDYPHQFSGGMRQRVLIAMALLARPDLLIADEPTSALDVTIEAQIAGLFAGLRRDVAGTILLITHSLGVVAELCDEIVVLYAGAVVETGPTGEVLARPRHPYTRALLASEIGEGSGPLPSIGGELPDLTAPSTGCVFAPRCSLASAECRAPQPLRELQPGHGAACHRA
ncbi:MAG: ABC transporter ATP-binding protein [Alphaproteobacteria bacterium]